MCKSLEVTYGSVKIISVETKINCFALSELKKHHFVSERFPGGSENSFNPIPPGLFEDGAAGGGGVESARGL